MIEPCAICHESGGEQVYCIPECNHKYHTNCIMTWFRTGHDTCPLCNNQGVNHGLNDTTWLNKLEALENYKHLRLYSRRKDSFLSVHFPWYFSTIPFSGSFKEAVSQRVASCHSINLSRDVQVELLGNSPICLSALSMIFFRFFMIVHEIGYC